MATQLVKVSRLDSIQLRKQIPDWLTKAVQFVEEYFRLNKINITSFDFLQI